MKRIPTLAAVALLGISTTGWAHDAALGGNPDLYESPLLDHGKGSQASLAQKGEGDLYGSHLANPEDVTPNPGANPEPIDRRNALHDQDPEGYGI